MVFTFFGDVYEEVLHWDPPHRYVYLARGDDFPVKDYIAQIEVFEMADYKGIMRWNVYCDVIEGDHFQKILPVMLPAINEASIHALAPLIAKLRGATLFLSRQRGRISSLRAVSKGSTSFRDLRNHRRRHEADTKARALAFRAVKRHRPAVTLTHALHNRQAQSRAIFVTRFASHMTFE